MNRAPDGRAALFSLDRRKSGVLRGIAILYVLLGHSGYLAWGGAGGVALFLMLSGYGLDRSFEQTGLGGYWKKRFFKVWLPYSIVGLFNVLALRETEPLRILCNVVGINYLWYRNLDDSMWYISFLLLWYAAYYLAAGFSRLIKNESLGRALRIILLFGCALLIPYLNRDQRFWDYSCGALRYVIFFPLGVTLSALSRVQVKEWARRLVWMILFFLASVYMFRVYGQPWTWKMAAAMALQILAPSQLLQVSGAAERVLLWFGKYAYPIYLFEWTVLRHRDQWLGVLKYQPLIDLGFLLLTALLAWAYWELYRLLEELAAAAVEKRRAL